jgi:large subunit ribosomal protein L24
MQQGAKKVRLKKGDQVVVIAGKDFNRFVKKGAKTERVPHRGRILEVDPVKGKVKVEGAGMIKRHKKANRQAGQAGGILEKEAWINISNVQLVDPDSGKPTRVKFKIGEDGAKIRIAADSGKTIEDRRPTN